MIENKPEMPDIIEKDRESEDKPGKTEAEKRVEEAKKALKEAEAFTVGKSVLVKESGKVGKIESVTLSSREAAVGFVGQEGTQVFSFDDLDILPEVKPPPEPKLETMKELVSELARVGSRIRGGGMFDSRGYIFMMDSITCRVGTDGWIEFHPSGTPGIRLGMPIQEFETIAKGALALARSGHVRRQYARDK